MDCRDAQSMILDDVRGQLAKDAQASLHEHVSNCTTCAHEAQAQAALNELLTHRTPRYKAPPSLRAHLTRAPSRRTNRLPVTRPWWWALAGAAAALVISAAISNIGARRIGQSAQTALVREAINDHLRITFSEHPIEIESGGIHQVKPWFSGKLEFAPRVQFAGDAEFPLIGGSVAYFVDRKAAAFVFKRRLHMISLLVFPIDGITWPASGLNQADRLKTTAASMHGFNVLLWERDGFGYALTSDVDRTELDKLALRLTSVN